MRGAVLGQNLGTRGDRGDAPAGRQGEVEGQQEVEEPAHAEQQLLPGGGNGGKEHLLHITVLIIMRWRHFTF